MIMSDPVKIHSERAMTELDLAVRAEHAVAARAHLALSVLHLERMREFCERQSPAPLISALG
jgi:hypothetical protein